MDSSISTEVYCYRVIYPAGTFVRVSPSLNAAKTGEILEVGSVFESIKSVFLDGINYVKLADGRGWVFHSRGETKVLELVEVIKRSEDISVPPPNPVETLDFQPRTPTYSRNRNMYWRDIRSKVRACSNFKEFSELVSTQLPNLPTNNGPARAAWMSDAPSEQQIRKVVALITSTTRKGADVVTNVDSLEAHLWVLVHMGSQVSHVMQITVDEANAVFESMSTAQRNDLLAIALEVGAATKIHNADLAKCADILSDDVRNFVQRYVIIKSRRIPPQEASTSPRTPKAAPVDSRTVVSPHDKRSPNSASAKKLARSSLTAPAAPPAVSSTWLSSLVCSPPPPAVEPESREMSDLSKKSGSKPTAPVPVASPATHSSFFSDMGNYVRRLTSDPEFQFAGLI